MVGVGGCTAVMASVLLVGQFTKLGVTITVYTIVLCVPIGITGDIMLEACVLLLPAKNIFGVHEKLYCAGEGGTLKEVDTAMLLPGHKVALVGVTAKV